MKVTYGHLKETLDESIKKEFDPEGVGPIEHYVKRVVIGKLQIPDFLNDCGDYCSHEAAIDYYKASLLIDPFQNHLLAKLALNYHLSCQNKKALKYIEKALMVAEKNVGHLELKQSILMKLRRFSEVLFLFEQINVIKPKSGTAYFNRGKAFIELGFYEKAIKSLLQAMEFDPEDKEIPFHLARIYRFHLLDEALADKYEALAGLFP